MESYIGSLLRGVTLSYFALGDRLRRYTTFTADVIACREPSLAYCGLVLEASSVLGSVWQVDGACLQFDVQRDVVNVVSRTANRAKCDSWMFMDGLIGSSGEHVVLEGLLGERAVSAQRLLRVAQQSGIAIHHLKSVADLSLPDAPKMDPAVERAVEARLAAGCDVIIPAEEVRYGDWRGSGWIELEEGGDAGFMISGGLAGGASVDKAVVPTSTSSPAPGWDGGHPLFVDYLYTAMIGKITKYTRLLVRDPRVPSGFREICSGRFAAHALGVAEQAHIARLGAMSVFAAGLWDAVWQVIDDAVGPDASKYLDNDLVVRRAILSFVVGCLNGLASLGAVHVASKSDGRLANAPWVAGVAVGCVISTGWSAIKKTVFLAAGLEPMEFARTPRFTDAGDIPDLFDPVRSAELVTTPNYF